MNAEEVQIVTLGPLRVASVRAFGESPEMLAWDELEAWAGPRGFLEGPAKGRVFGFDNPGPSPDSLEYGYELWVTVGPELPSGEVGGATVAEFGGGLYAVLRCVATDPARDIPAGWERLAEWVAGSAYAQGEHQWLEEHLGPPSARPLVLDLHLPIAS